MFCDGCVFYHPFREKRCSIAPRTRVENVKRCGLREEASVSALALRTVEPEEQERYVAWMKNDGKRQEDTC